MHRYILFLAVIVAAAQAQKMVFGGCPKITPKTPFNMTLFSGKWYVHYKYNTTVEDVGKCATGTYVVNGTGMYILKTVIDKKTSAPVIIPSIATYKGNNSVGAFNLAFPGGQVSGSIPYYVIDTDYANWAVTYICADYGVVNFQVLYLLHRSKLVLPGWFNAADAAIDAQGLDRKNMPSVEQTCGLFY